MKGTCHGWAGTAVAVGILFLEPGLCQVKPTGSPDSRSPTVTHHRRDLSSSSVNLIGKVVTETGEAPSQLVQVDLVCNGRIKLQTLTLPDGSFSMDLGAPRNNDWLDPSMGGSYDGTLQTVGSLANPGAGRVLNRGEPSAPDRVELGGCELHVAPKAGFTSDSIPLRSRDPMENPDVGVLVLRRISGTGATTVSLNTLSAPGKSQEGFRKAIEELDRDKPDLKKASQLLDDAIDKYPRFSAAWELLARIQLAQDKNSEARSSLLKAIEAEPGFLSPYLVLAQISIQHSDWSETVDWTGKVLSLDGSHPTALYWNGLAHYYLGRLNRAEQPLSRLYAGSSEMELKYPFGLLPLGVIHANQGRIQEAGRELNRYLEVMPPERISPEQRRQLTTQIASWESAGLLETETPESTVAQTSPK